MRAFNDREKEILKTLVTIDLNYGGTFERFLQDKIFTKERGIALFIFNDAFNDALRSIHIHCRSEDKLTKFREFLEIFTLMEYLQENRWVYTVQSRDISPPQSFIYSQFSNASEEPDRIILNGNGDYLSRADYDIYSGSNVRFFTAFRFDRISSDMFDRTIKNLTGLIHVSEALIDFVKNNFKTVEQRQFEDQIGLAKSQHEEQSNISEQTHDDQMKLAKEQFSEQIERSERQFKVEQRQFEDQLKLEKSRHEEQLTISGEKHIEQMDLAKEQFSKQKRATRLGIGIAIVSAALSLIIPVIKTDTVKLEESQIRILNNASNQLQKYAVDQKDFHVMETEIDRLRSQSSGLEQKVKDLNSEIKYLKSKASEREAGKQ
jgi:hypothetical protein